MSLVKYIIPDKLVEGELIVELRDEAPLSQHGLPPILGDSPSILSQTHHKRETQDVATCSSATTPEHRGEVPSCPRSL